MESFELTNEISAEKAGTPEREPSRIALPPYGRCYFLEDFFFSASECSRLYASEEQFVERYSIYYDGVPQMLAFRNGNSGIRIRGRECFIKAVWRKYIGDPDSREYQNCFAGIPEEPLRQMRVLSLMLKRCVGGEQFSRFALYWEAPHAEAEERSYSLGAPEKFLSDGEELDALLERGAPAVFLTNAFSQLAYDGLLTVRQSEDETLLKRLVRNAGLDPDSMDLEKLEELEEELSMLSDLETSTRNTPQPAKMEKENDFTGVEISGTVLVRWREKKREYTIPEGITEIGEAAFEYCDNLRKITIPDSVQKLGVSCFNGCSKLKSVTLSRSVSVIPESCFAFCGALREIELPESIQMIGNCAFVGCDSLSDISFPSGLKYIGGTAFGGCAFRKISLPVGLETIESCAFWHCLNLKEATIPCSVVDMPRDIFEACHPFTAILDENGHSRAGEVSFTINPLTDDEDDIDDVSANGEKQNE